MDPILHFGLDVKFKLLGIEGLREKNLMSLGLQLHSIDRQIHLIRILNIQPAPNQDLLSTIYKSSLPLLLRTRSKVTSSIDRNLTYMNDLLLELQIMHERGMSLLKDVENSGIEKGTHQALLESIMKRIRATINNSDINENEMESLLFAFMKSISMNRIRKRTWNDSCQRDQDASLISSKNPTVKSPKKKKRIRLLSEDESYPKSLSSFKFSSLPHHQPSSIVSSSQKSCIREERKSDGILSFSNSLPSGCLNLDFHNLHVPESSQIPKELSTDFRNENEKIEKIECSNQDWLAEVIFPPELERKVKVDLTQVSICESSLENFQSVHLNADYRSNELSTPVSLSPYTDSAANSGSNHLPDVSIDDLDSNARSSPSLVRQSERFLSNSILRSDPLNTDMITSLSGSLSNSKSQCSQPGKENSLIYS